MLPKEQLIDTVAEDLRYLREEWDESIDDHSLRRSSTVLRRLLVQNELQRAWKAAGFNQEPIVTASSLNEILSKIPIEKIMLASAGGARYQGIEVRGALLVNYAMSNAERVYISSEGPPEETLGLRSFIEQPCIVADNNKVSRRELIKYISNKLGGAHYDTKRAKNEKVFSLLDKVSLQFNIADKNIIYYELLSTGQSLVQSEDIVSFCDKVIEN